MFRKTAPITIPLFTVSAIVFLKYFALSSSFAGMSLPVVAATILWGRRAGIFTAILTVLGISFCFYLSGEPALRYLRCIAFLIEYILLCCMISYLVNKYVVAETAEQKFKEIIDTVPVMIWQIDAQQRITYLSKSFIDFTGLDPKSVGEWHQTVHPDDLPTIYKGYELCRQQKPYDIDYRLRDKQGGYVWVRLMAVPRCDDKGNHTGYVGVMSDISSQHRYEEAVRDKQHRAELEVKRKEFFFNAISHDIKTPLNSIGLNSQVIEMILGTKGELDPDIRECVQNIRSGAMAANELLGKILDLARSSYNVNTIEVFPLEGVLVDVVKKFTPFAENKNLKLSFQCEAGLEVRSDIAKLRRAVSNLVDNAIKFTSKGEVKIEGYMENGTVCIAVTDTGIGISPENTKLLFAEFYQIHNYGRDKAKGFGLGLAIARTLADQLAGELRLDHSNESGSRFELCVQGRNKHGTGTGS